MQELYKKRLQKYGPSRARLFFLFDVLTLLHPHLWCRKHSSSHYIQKINMSMFSHILMLTCRNFLRYKGSFFINLIGLSTGLSCTLLIYLWVQDELGVDKFHQHDSRLYQVMKKVENRGAGKVDVREPTPGLLAEALEEEMPEVESAVSVIPYRGKPGILIIGNAQVRAREQYVGKNFFTIFSYPLLQGDKHRVLHDKHSVVLSEELALKMFGTHNVIGNTVRWEKEKVTGTYQVSGVFKKPPYNATEQFDLVFSFALYRTIKPEIDQWTWGDPNTYVLLKEGASRAPFAEKIGKYLQGKTLEAYPTLFIRPYSDKYLYNTFENGVQAGGRIEYVRLFSVIAVFIFTIASINFMNLSTAKASRRLKEVGIKKAIGAGRKTLVFQFLSESVLMAFISMLLALFLAAILLPGFNQITGKQLALHPNLHLVLTILAITLFTGFASGSYPALYLSGFHPMAVLKGKTHTYTGEAWARKGLVVFQFTLSVILMVSVMVVYKQVDYIQSKNLGYSRDNILVFKKEGKLEESYNVFLQEVKKIPGVINASNTWGNLTGADNISDGLVWEGKRPGEYVTFHNLGVNYDFIETVGIQLKEGRAFSRHFSTDSTKIIFTERAIRAMGLQDPVGKTVRLWGQDREIIGVAKDFHFESLYEPVKPCFLILVLKADNMMVKIKAGMEKETLERLTKFYRAFNQGTPFEYKFLDQEYQAQYASEQRVSVLSQYFAGIAIIIASLGLLGLAAFTAERRKKEIGIRKILGSSEAGIVYLLSGDFTRLVVLAILIAQPVSYLLTQGWLESFAYHIDLEPWYFVMAGLLALGTALFTVGLQALKAASMNPVQCLKDE